MNVTAPPEKPRKSRALVLGLAAATLIAVLVQLAWMIVLVLLALRALS